MKKTIGKPCPGRGFTLIELMVVVVIIAILTGIAYPSYSSYVIRSSRQAAMAELTELANLQEKIYLNSNGYSASVTNNYNGRSDGGLGKTSGKSSDNKYNITVTPATSGQTYTLTATPVTGSTQSLDGNISINSSGTRAWGNLSW
ncbi:MAG: type IV pilin protein [Pseudomonadota bacterium]